MEEKVVETKKKIKQVQKKVVEKMVKATAKPSVWAVVDLSGSQFKVTEGEELSIDRVETEKGKTFDVTKVYLLSDGSELKIGQPEVAGAKVTFEVLKDERGKKINVFKFKAKARYRKRHGHQADLSRIKVAKISW